MINKMMAFVVHIAACEWKDKIGCKGCKANRGIMFWGKCDKAICCIERGLNIVGNAQICPAKAQRPV